MSYDPNEVADALHASDLAFIGASGIKGGLMAEGVITVKLDPDLDQAFKDATLRARTSSTPVFTPTNILLFQVIRQLGRLGGEPDGGTDPQREPRIVTEPGEPG